MISSPSPNPYIAGSPISGTEMFFGREDVFEFVRKTLTGQHRDNIVVLYGQRRTGKTSVLYQMHRRLSDRYLCIFIDLHGLALDSLDGFLWELANYIHRRLRKEYEIQLPKLNRSEFMMDARNTFVTTFLDGVWSAIGDRHLLLMLDETIRLEEQVRAGKLEKDVFDYMRHMMQVHPRLNFLFSLGSGLEQLQKEYAFLFSVALYKKISFLDQASAEALITQPVKEYYQVQPEAVARILQITSAHPYFTQLVCHSLFYYAQEKLLAQVGPNDVELIVGEAVERGLAVLKHIWEESLPAEKAVLAGMAAAMAANQDPTPVQVSVQEIRSQWADLNAYIPRDEISRAVRNLVAREVIVGSDPYTFTVDLQRLYVQKYCRLEWVREEIKEELRSWAGTEMSQGIQNALDLDLPTNQFTIVSDAPLTIPFGLFYKGRTTELVQISLQGLPTGWKAEVPAEIKLLPGARQESLIVVRPLPPPRCTSGSYTFAIQASSHDGDVQNITASGTLFVPEIHRLQAEIQPVHLLAGEQARLVIHNEGNQSASGTISFFDLQSELVFQPSQARLENLPPGESFELLFRAGPRRPRLLGDKKVFLYSAQVFPHQGDSLILDGEVAIRGRFLAAYLVLGLVALAIVIGIIWAFQGIIRDRPQTNIAIKFTETQANNEGVISARTAAVETSQYIQTQSAPATITPPVPPTDTKPVSATLSLPVHEGTPMPQNLPAISYSNVIKVAELARWGDGATYQVALSPNSKVLAVAHSLGVYLYDAESLQPIQSIEINILATSVAFSPDSNYFAAALQDGSIRIWKTQNGEPVRTIEGHGDMVRIVIFSPDGNLLASGSVDGTLRLWRTSDGSLVKVLEGHSKHINSLAISPDGKILASASGDNTAKLWQIPDGSLLMVLKAHTAPVTALAFSPDGQVLATASLDTTVRLWQVSDGKILQTLRHSEGVATVAFSPDGSLLASGSRDTNIRIWRVSDGVLLNTLEGHRALILSLVFYPDGQIIASLSDDGTIRQWRVADGKLVRAAEKYTGLIRSLAVSPDGHLLATGTRNGTIQLWDVETGKTIRKLEGHTDSVTSLSFSPGDNNLLVSGSDDKTVKIWQVSSGAILHTFTGNKLNVESVAVSPDGQLVASGAFDGTVRVWEISDEKLIETFSTHTQPVWSVAFSPGGDMLASSSLDGSVVFRRVSDWTLVKKITVKDKAQIWSIAFSPDGRTLATSEDGGLLSLWQVSDGALLWQKEGHTDQVWSLNFSPDSQMLASGSFDRTIRLWRVSDGELLQTLSGHTDHLSSIAFTENGKLIASSSWDGTVRIWGVAP
jgi:WD40 repeat protein